MIDIVTLAIVAANFLYLVLMAQNNRRFSKRSDKVIEENNAARAHIKAALADIQERLSGDGCTDGPVGQSDSCCGGDGDSDAGMDGPSYRSAVD